MIIFMKKKPVMTQDVIQVLKMLGLNMNVQTGGYYCENYKNQTISKNQTGAYNFDMDGKNIAFLNGSLFLSTVQMVENSLNYKLFQ